MKAKIVRAKLSPVYSHLENDDFTEETICSSIKLTPAAKIDMVASMELTAFTYRDMGYFTDTGEYLGSNAVTISILDKNKQ